MLRDIDKGSTSFFCRFKDTMPPRLKKTEDSNKKLGMKLRSKTYQPVSSYFYI
jgi:hypothetical protein